MNRAGTESFEVKESPKMPAGTFSTRWNQDAIEAAYDQWKADPASVDNQWRLFFEGYELGVSQTPSARPDALDGSQIVRLIDAYRELGHFIARLDPLSDPPPGHPQLELSRFGYSDADRNRTWDTSYFL